MANNQRASWQQLIDWIEGKLSPADAALVAQQVERADEFMRADVAWIRAFLRAGEEIALDGPPDEVRTTLMASFDDYARSRMANTPMEERAVDGPNLLQRWIAVLTFDSGLQPGIAGARAGATPDRRQVVYSSDILDLSLSLQRETSGLRIEGQLLPNQELQLDAFHTRIYRQVDVVADATVDQTGRFSFFAIQPDVYKFLIGSDEMSIWIELLDLSV